MSKNLKIAAIVFVVLLVIGSITAVILFLRSGETLDIRNKAFETRKFSSTLCGGGSDLIFETDTSSFKVGQKYTVSIIVDTHGCKIDGVDTRISYDYKYLDVDKDDTALGEDFSTLANNKVTTSLIKISALAGINKPVSGDLTVATFSFTPKKKGTTSLKFKFTQGSTVDSNVVENKTTQDILGSVEDLEIVIQ